MEGWHLPCSASWVRGLCTAVKMMHKGTRTSSSAAMPLSPWGFHYPGYSGLGPEHAHSLLSLLSLSIGLIQCSLRPCPSSPKGPVRSPEECLSSCPCPTPSQGSPTGCVPGRHRCAPRPRPSSSPLLPVACLVLACFSESLFVTHPRRSEDELGFLSFSQVNVQRMGQAAESRARGREPLVAAWLGAGPGEAGVAAAKG